MPASLHAHRSHTPGQEKRAEAPFLRLGTGRARCPLRARIVVPPLGLKERGCTETGSQYLQSLSYPSRGRLDGLVGELTCSLARVSRGDRPLSALSSHAAAHDRSPRVQLQRTYVPEPGSGLSRSA